MQLGHPSETTGSGIQTKVRQEKYFQSHPPPHKSWNRRKVRRRSPPSQAPELGVRPERASRIKTKHLQNRALASKTASPVLPGSVVPPPGLSLQVGAQEAAPSTFQPEQRRFTPRACTRQQPQALLKNPSPAGKKNNQSKVQQEQR